MPSFSILRSKAANVYARLLVTPRDMVTFFVSYCFCNCYNVWETYARDTCIDGFVDEDTKDER